MAGRYDRNPFDEDDVNPFAVSCLVNFFSWLAATPHSASTRAAVRLVFYKLVPWSAGMGNLSGSPLEFGSGGFLAATPLSLPCRAGRAWMDLVELLVLGLEVDSMDGCVCLRVLSVLVDLEEEG
jgi:hypothetical protein